MVRAPAPVSVAASSGVTRVAVRPQPAHQPSTERPCLRTTQTLSISTFSSTLILFNPAASPTKLLPRPPQPVYNPLSPPPLRTPTYAPRAARVFNARLKNF